jgi:hypothetical protein
VNDHWEGGEKALSIEFQDSSGYKLIFSAKIESYKFDQGLHWAKIRRLRVSGQTGGARRLTFENLRGKPEL